MQKILRPYQLEALTNLRKRLKETTNPLLVNASVGSGKSLIIAELLLVIEKAGWKALCLTMNSTLIKQNHETYELQGGNPGIYCAALKEKNITKPIIFGSPNSILKGIKSKKAIADIRFNLIVVDEAHNISPTDRNSMYQCVLNHYGMQAQFNNYSFRVVGLTGTPYRGKGIHIVGDKQYFKEEVCSISTGWLIEQKYLTPPYFGHKHVDGIDFSKVRVDKMGKFKHKELEEVVKNNLRLTGEIMLELQRLTCRGIFIFASTIQHCEECLKSLPSEQSAMITGDTPHEQRKEILQKANDGIIKYLVNVNCLCVGIDIPAFDVCAWLRPTESLVLYTQGIGRVLRLYPGKSRALILDYAGNLERHGDIDNPIINSAIQPTDDDSEEFEIPCYDCATLNKVTARRCIGVLDKKRCEHYFEFKPCPECEVQNDITSRHCRSCKIELVDPNKKLNKQGVEVQEFIVMEGLYWVSNETSPVINVRYKTNKQDVFEKFYTNSEKAKNVCYAKFIRQHVPNASEYYPDISNLSRMITMIHNETIMTPNKLLCRKENNGRYSVVKKVFDRNL